jgi:2'-5' RNA ligase
MLYGIITFIHDDPTAKISQAWRELRQKCGVPEENLSSVPRLTWHIADNYNMTEIGDRLTNWCARKRAFWLQATGIGLFPAPEPVLYISVLKNPRLVYFHQSLFKLIRPFSINPSEYYSPEAWTPHVTLAFGKLPAQSLGCAVQNLAYDPFTIHFKVDQLTLVCQDSQEKWSVLKEIPFRPGKTERKVQK